MSLDADRRRQLTLVATILASGIVFLDGTVVNVALPAIRADLDTGLASQQWIVEAYLLTLAAFLLVGGALGDRFGRRRVLELGLAGFALASLACALAPSDEVLVGARAVQGIAGALLVPGTLAILTATFDDPAERGAAIGSWTAWTGLAFVIGPLGGGLLVDVASWRWIFAINLPFVAGTLWLIRAAVAESCDPRSRGGVDIVGAGLCALGLAGPVFALIEQPTRGWGDPLVAVPGLAGLALLAAFVVWEARGARSPMLPLAIFRVRNFAVGNLTTLTVYAGLGASTFFVVIYLQQLVGYSALAAGVALLPVTLMMLVLSRRFGAVSERIGPRPLMGFGPVVAAVGLFLLGRIPADAAYLTDVLPGTLIFGLGLSMTVAPLTATVLGAVDRQHAGLASGANNAIARVATLLAVAVVGAVIAAAYEADLPDGAPASVRSSPLAPPAPGVPDAGAIVSASQTGYATGMGVAAALVALGGLISLAGIEGRRAAVAAR